MSVETDSTSARLTFVVTVLVHGTETYGVNYGTTTVLGQTSEYTTVSFPAEYNIIVSNLRPGTTYYFQLSGTNNIGTTFSGIVSATTLEEGKYK